VKFKVYSATEQEVKYTPKSKKTPDAHQEKIDKILDKISKSGYESLSNEEKDLLFKASNK